MSLRRIAFVTSSADKYREAQAILPLEVEHVKLDLKEPQGLDVIEIARAKARAAFDALAKPVLVEDTSLELAALGGFPGPLVRWLMDSAGPSALAKMLDGFSDRRATARCVAIIWDGANEWLGLGEVAGAIVEAPRGSGGFGWDVVFAPAWGGGRTYAEMTDDEKNTRSHRALALQALVLRFSN